MEFIDMRIDSACNFSLINKLNGDYLFTILISGKCETLSSRENYIYAYDEMLQQHEQEIEQRDGIITFINLNRLDYAHDSTFVNELIRITAQRLEGKAKLVSHDEYNMAIHLDLNDSQSTITKE